MHVKIKTQKIEIKRYQTDDYRKALTNSINGKRLPNKYIINKAYLINTKNKLKLKLDIIYDGTQIKIKNDQNFLFNQLKITFKDRTSEIFTIKIHKPSTFTLIIQF